HFTPFPLRYSATSLSPNSLMVVSSLAASIFHASQMSFRILRLSALSSMGFPPFGFFLALIELYIHQYRHKGQAVSFLHAIVDSQRVRETERFSFFASGSLTLRGGRSEYNGPGGG